MRLGTLTALDTAGVRPHRQADGSYYHACVACGSAATTGNWHTQCSDPSCTWQVFSPLDILAAKFGDHRKAASVVNDQLRRREVAPETVAWETARREVLDFWLTRCLGRSPTMKVATQTASLREKGWYLLPEQRGIAVITGETIVALLELAERTGASFPDSMRSNPPPSAIAYVVQTLPHTIDRIVVTVGKGQECAVSWVKKRVGIVGMLGLSPDHLLASDYQAALALQRHLHDLGQPREVAAIYVAKDASPFREPWRPDIGKLTTVVANAEDIVRMSMFYDAFPLATDHVEALHHRSLVAMSGSTPVPWSWMRRSYLAAAIGNGAARELSGAAIHLLEQSQPSRDEVAWLIQRYREMGRLELAEDIKRQLDNRVIFNDGKLKIRETASEYLIDYGGSTSSIANFAIGFTHNLFFRDSADMFHQGRLNYGRTSLDVTIGAHAIDNINELQKTVRHQMLLHRADSTPEQLPTIIDSATMRRHVVPHLKRQVSSLPSKEGFCNMGWTADRGMFVGPGMKVTLSGRESGPVHRHPNVLPLRHFEPDGSWDVGFSTDLPLSARDVIAMTLASCVRFFVKSVTRPVCIQHSPSARHLLKTMFAAVGQREIYELNPNLRDHSSTQGVRGYPFLTTGYNAAQVVNARFGHVLLTDTGYSVGDEVDQAAAEAAGRSLQFGLLRVVEWCIATGAEEFSEVPALHFNSSLLREGKWLVENVCELQPWEVSDIGLLHLEDIFAQIPATETTKRLKIEDGTTLTADMTGLKWDRDKVREDLRVLRSRCDGEGDSLVMGAVEVMPAMALYYGRSPEVAVVI